MTVQGKQFNPQKEKKLFLRMDVGSGTFKEGKKTIKFDISMNVDGKCIFIEFENGEWVQYYVADMAKDAYEMVFRGGKQ